MDKLVALRKELEEVAGQVSTAYELAGEDYNFGSKEVLDHLGAADSADATSKVRDANKRMNDLGDEIKPLAELEKGKIQAENFLTATGLAAGTGDINNGMIHAGKPRMPKLIGDVILSHDAFKERARGESVGFEIPDYGLAELMAFHSREVMAADFLTTAGWDPFDPRIARVIPAATRPIQVLDIIPMGNTGASTVKYMRETTRTHVGAERAEGAVYAESAFVLTEQSDEVRTIGEAVPVSDEQLEDVAAARSYLNMRLAFGVRQRLDRQVIVGNGTAPNLSGITDRTGIQTQAIGSDTAEQAIYKAMTKVDLVGRAMVDFVVLHHNDWQDIRLRVTTDGEYIWGSPAMQGPETIFGKPVVKSDSLTENTGLVGDFTAFCMIFERRGVMVQAGYNTDDFSKGMQTIRAGLRAAFSVFRPTAFCTVTGI